MKLKKPCMPNRIYIHNFHKGNRVTSAGIILRDDNGTSHGVRPRWVQIYAVGSDFEHIVKEGDWVYVQHGRWSRPVQLNEEETIYRVDPDAILLVSEEEPVDDVVMDTYTYT